MDENYTFTPASGTLTITKVMLTITADGKTKSYGSANPSFTVSYSGFVGSDNAGVLTTLPTASTTAVTGSNAGSYPITPSGAVDESYDFTYVNGSLSVTQVALTVTADNQSKVYGAALPTLTFAYSGFVGSDNAGGIDTPPSISTTALVSSNAGTYPITLSGGTDNNYTFSLTPP